jgi:CheY-like chemotaxis protein
MEAVGQLAGSVAHDFNNLLTIIQTCATFVRDGLREVDAELVEDVDGILAAARRAADLTHRLVAFAKQAPLSPRDVDVAAALREIDALLRRTLGGNIVLVTEVDEGVTAVNMDPTAFDQVIVNLAVNARDAMPGGGRLTIEATRLDLTESWSVQRGVALEPGAYVVISVTDTGHGIPIENQERIFDPFFTTKGEGRGTGLGLATCWGLVRQAGGTISVYSEPGAGTTLRVYLPVAASSAARSAVTEQEPPPAAPARSRVLVVDDDDTIRALVVRVLRQEAHVVFEARSAAEAMLLADENGGKVDLLLSDVVLQGMSGIELADRMRRRYPALRVLLVSGFAPLSLASQGLLGDGTAFLAKPFSPKALVEAVRRALGHS